MTDTNRQVALEAWDRWLPRIGAALVPPLVLGFWMMRKACDADDQRFYNVAAFLGAGGGMVVLAGSVAWIFGAIYLIATVIS